MKEKSTNVRPLKAGINEIEETPVTTMTTQKQIATETEDESVTKKNFRKLTGSESNPTTYRDARKQASLTKHNGKKYDGRK